MAAIQQSFYIYIIDWGVTYHIILGIILCSIPTIQDADYPPELSKDKRETSIWNIMATKVCTQETCRPNQPSSS